MLLASPVNAHRSVVHRGNEREKDAEEEMPGCERALSASRNFYYRVHGSRVRDPGIIIRENISRRARKEERKKGEKGKPRGREGRAMPRAHVRARARARRNDISTTDAPLADSLGHLLRACRLRTYLN